MITKKLILNTLVGTVSFFFLGWIIYGMLLADFMQAHYNHCMDKTMENYNWLALVASNFFSALLISVICNWADVKNLTEGLKIGAIVGFLMGCAMDLSFFAMMDMYLSRRAIVVDIASYTVMTAIVAGIIGLISGKTDSDV
jgi:fluoride ion exporter CrcB/FEX